MPQVSVAEAIASLFRARRAKLSIWAKVSYRKGLKLIYGVRSSNLEHRTDTDPENQIDPLLISFVWCFLKIEFFIFIQNPTARQLTVIKRYICWSCPAVRPDLLVFTSTIPHKYYADKDREPRVWFVHSCIVWRKWKTLMRRFNS